MYASLAGKTDVPPSVAKKFVGPKAHAEGGEMKKLPPFMGKESKAEEAKEMKVKRMSPALYKKGEKAEGVHGKSGKEKPTKYAKGGGVEARGKGPAKQVKMMRGGSCG
jgi:hypothetical protein